MTEFPTQTSPLNQPINLQYEEKVIGFNARNISSLPETYICKKCKLLLRDPVQLSCGHRFCQLCVNIGEHSIIKCTICNIETSQDRMINDQDCRNDMESLQISCSFCEWDDIFKSYPRHLSTNHTDLSCEYCNKKFDTANLYLQHQLECEQMIINCQLKPYGCTEQFLRMNTQKHLLTAKHQIVMLNILSQTTNNLRNDRTDEQIEKSEMDFDFPQTTISTSDSSDGTLNETLNILFGSVQSLNDDTQHHSLEIIRSQYALQSLSVDLKKIKTSVEEINSSAEAIQTNHQIILQDFTSLQQNVEDQQAISYNGTLIWRITDVQKKIADAQSERQTSIYSPPFYSSHNGYKMCARLYLYGDGAARRTHISAFFVLMRGEHDAILHFPFNFKVTFCLYDQSGQEQHHIDSFRPDTKSSSFHRPQLEMNVASGIPKFFPISTIQQYNNPYVRNDTMFIKIMVHFDEIPKKHLKNILAINPGLSIDVQQTMIKHQLEKPAEQSTTITDSSIIPSTINNDK